MSVAFCEDARLALAVLTGVTRSRTSVVWFKVCLPVLTTSAVLLVVTSAR